MIHGFPPEDAIPRFSLADVRTHDNDNSCWIVVIDFVFDVTQFLRLHPGGDEVFLENAGRDATSAVLDETQHSATAIQIMKGFCVGKLVTEECVNDVIQKNHRQFYTIMEKHLLKKYDEVTVFQNESQF